MKAQHVDLLFVGGGFENFNWLADTVVQPPFFAAICIFNRRAIDPMKFAVQTPLFGVIGENFANWLLVTHTQL